MWFSEHKGDFPEAVLIISWKGKRKQNHFKTLLLLFYLTSDFLKILKVDLENTGSRFIRKLFLLSQRLLHKKKVTWILSNHEVGLISECFNIIIVSPTNYFGLWKWKKYISRVKKRRISPRLVHHLPKRDSLGKQKLHYQGSSCKGYLISESFSILQKMCQITTLNFST